MAGFWGGVFFLVLGCFFSPLFSLFQPSLQLGTLYPGTRLIE